MIAFSDNMVPREALISGVLLVIQLALVLLNHGHWAAVIVLVIGPSLFGDVRVCENGFLALLRVASNDLDTSAKRSLLLWALLHLALLLLL